jgi:pimeloyl-ACP methyl ester carboxylesterase
MTDAQDLSETQTLSAGGRFRPLLHAGGAGAIALAGAALHELRHRRHLSAAPEHIRFRSPLRGEGVQACSADGTELYAEVLGGDEGPTFVLAPGWTETLHYFDSMTRLLVDRGFRVVAYDLRGQGRSGRPAGGDYALARYGEDLDAVLAATCKGRDDVIVAGHSMGAMSIAAWADAHDVSARVRGAVLMNTGLDGLIAASKILPKVLPPRIATPLALYAFLGNPLPFPALSTSVGRAAIRYTAFGAGASAAQVAFYERMLMTCPPAVRRGAGIAMAQMDLVHALVHLTVPTLVLAGGADRLTPPSHAHRIVEALPQSAGLKVFPGVGHMGPLEVPERFVEALVAFSGSLPAAVAAAA